MAKKGVERGVKRTAKYMSLDEIDHRLLAALDKTPAMTHKDLANLVGMSVSGVTKRYKKPAFQNALLEITKSTWDLILRAKQVSARRLLNLANDPDPKIAMDAAKILFGPTLQDTNINVREVKEVIYRTKFGDSGQLVQEVEEILEDPKDALELITGIRRG